MGMAKKLDHIMAALPARRRAQSLAAGCPE